MHLRRGVLGCAFTLSLLGGCSSNDGPSEQGPATSGPAPSEEVVPPIENRGPTPQGFKPNGWTPPGLDKARSHFVEEDARVDIVNEDNNDSIGIKTQHIGRSVDLWTGHIDTVNELGTVEVHRGGIIERYTPQRLGMQQSWEFGTKPAGTGDLVVRAAVEGVLSATEVPAGLKLTTAKGDFLYTTASWLDALGTTTVVPVKWTGTAVEMIVPAAVVESSTYPASLDPLTGVDNTNIRGYGTNVGSDGTRSLVVWEEYAAGSLVGKIKGRFVDANGTQHTAFAISDTAATTTAAEPAVASDGAGSFVVVWTNRTTKSTVNAARFSYNNGTGVGTRQGNIVAANVGSAVTAQYSPTVSCRASTSPKCGLAFHQIQSGGAYVSFTTLADSGSPTVNSTFVSTTPEGASTYQGYAASLVNDGTRFYVAWEAINGSSNEIGFSAFAFNGAAFSKAVTVTLLAPGTVGADYVYSPNLVLFSSQVTTATGTTTTTAKLGLGYTHYSAANSEDARIVRLTDSFVTHGLSGQVVTDSHTDTLGTHQTLATGAGTDEGSVLAACLSATSCVATYYTSTDIATRTFQLSSSTGEIVVGGASSTLVTGTGAQQNQHIAANSSNYFSSWDDMRSGHWQTYGATVSSGGSAGTATLQSP